ncbi:MAG: 2-polyprenylphenol 6-hydroxylase [Maricaulaceae bacterium]|jgi:ubiquinone biosynthesis protein
MFATIASLGRLARAAFVLARHDALLPKEYQDKLPATARLLGRLARLLARRDDGANPGARFARALEKLGPAYVKLGQFLATRGDIFGPEFTEGLASLKDSMAAFPTLEAERAIEAEFGHNPGSLFSAFGPPVAAASVAQVHKAQTTDGKLVAVKVLRPNIERRLERDVRAFRLGAAITEALAPGARRLEPKAFVETLARSLKAETDLRLEAAAASELGDQAMDIENFVAPAVDWSRSGRRVLTTEWVDGAPLTDPAALDALGIDREALATTVVRAFLACALDHGSFHADMHEGNLFATKDGELAAVDFGIVGRIGPAERRYLAEILYGFIERDYERVAKVHFEAGYVPESHRVEDFASALRAVGEPVFGKSADQVSMGRLLLQLFDITDLFDMHLRPALVLLQKTMVQVEGVARRLDPQHDIWAAARPVVERWIRRELGPEGVARDAVDDLRRLRDAVKRLPTALEEFNTAASAVAAGGVRLDDDTLSRLAKANARETRGRGLAIWVIAISGAALAGAAVAAALGL